MDGSGEGGTTLGRSPGDFKPKSSPASPEATQRGPLHNLVTTMFPARKSNWHGYERGKSCCFYSAFAWATTFLGYNLG